jgi:nicotinamidase-related amidase
VRASDRGGLESIKKPVLLLIDMQNDFVLEDAPLTVSQGRVVIPKIPELLDGFRAEKLPVFNVIRVHRADGSDVEIIRQEST